MGDRLKGCFGIHLIGFDNHILGIVPRQADGQFPQRLQEPLLDLVEFCVPVQLVVEGQHLDFASEAAPEVVQGVALVREAGVASIPGPA